jgi:phosphatidylinositol alpha-1,6-mannosyltransferase
MSPLATLLARLTGAKSIIQLHGIEIWDRPTRWRRRALEAANLLLCVSRDTRARVLAQVNIVPERAIVLNNTVEPRFEPGDRTAARKKFGLGSEYAVLTVGRLAAGERYKGHDRIISALPKLKTSDGRHVIYLIAGEGDDRSRLELAARDAGVAERVRFLGRVEPDDLPDLYRAADLFALLSTGEGFGIAFIEAMACGTPAVGLAIGGSPDALGDGALGTLLAPDADAAKGLAAAVAAPRVTPENLATRVRAHFGNETFRSRVRQALALAE